MKYFIFPYTQNSAGAIALAEELQGKRVLREGSSYSYQPSHCLINWGASDCPYPQALNKDIRAVLDKRVFFERLKDTGLSPTFATTLEGAKELGYPVFCRTQVKGRDGAGIVVADSNQDLVDAPLYVKGFHKTHEYRVHVGRLPNGLMTIGQQMKRRLAQTDEMTNVPKDNRVWCGDTTGFIWTLNGFPIVVPSEVKKVVDEAFLKFPELAFGAFDVVYNNNTNRAYVIEINSAPMMTPETARRYGDFFRKYAETLPQVTASPETASAPEVVSEPILQINPQPAPVQSVAQPQLSAQTVLNQLYNGQLSMQQVVEGYIQHVQG
jgi:hypothetical protein